MKDKIPCFLVLAAVLGVKAEVPVVRDEAGLRAAIEGVRNEQGRGTSPREILIEGTVRLSSPLVLTPLDHDLVIRGGKNAALSGGLRLEGWKDRGDGVWTALLPPGPDGKPVYFEQLFVNGRRADCARLPNGEGTHFTTDRRGREGLRQKGVPLGKNWNDKIPSFGLNCFGFGRVPMEAMEVLGRLSDGELTNARQIRHVRWDIDRHPIVYLERDIGLVGVPIEPWGGYNDFHKGDLVHFENVRTAFDAPGEWYYDAAGRTVQYRPLPGETIGSFEAIAPRDALEALVVIAGSPEGGAFVERIAFRDLAFEHTDAKPYRGKTLFTSYQSGAITCEATVLADGARHVSLENCRVRHNGSYAVWFRRGCMSNAVVRCEFSDLGGGGVKIGCFRLTELDFPMRGAVVFTDYGPRSTAFNRVEDCLITDGGRVHMAGCGVLIGHASDNVVTHNEIRELYYTGVSVGWVWGYSGSVAQRNAVTFNYIHDIGRGELADMGGVYTLGTSFGTVVSNNVIHTVRSYSYGGWGLYTDEGSEGVVMENNLVYDTQQNGYHHHYGRDNVIRNNIFYGSQLDEGMLAMSRREDHHSVSFERNIVCSKFANMLSGCGDSGLFVAPEKCTWKGNLWWCSTGRAKFDKDGLPFDGWQKLGRDTDGCEADPLFADPSRGDFSLRPGSPALRCGFRPFDWRLAGRRP